MTTRRILIVDDKEDNVYFMRAMLEGYGWLVDEAGQGAEALVRARQSPPDLIISDLLMPVMDGYTLLRHWKSDERLKQIPFFVYTATYTDPKDEQLALDLGADAFIIKPEEPDVFMTRVKEVLDRQARGTKSPAEPQIEDQELVLHQYNETLVRKLEQKRVELEQANRDLIRDIADRKKAEELLWESEARFRLLAEHINQVFWILDPAESKNLYVSPAFESIWGLQCEGSLLSERAWLETVHPEDRKWVEAAAATKQTVGEYDEVYRIVRPDGVVRWIHDRAFPVRNEQGQVYRVVGIAEDITGRKDAEAKLRSANEELEARVRERTAELEASARELISIKEEAERANASKSEFLSLMSHELRTPLNAVIGYAQLLQMRTDDPATQESAHSILRGGRHLLELVNEVLDLARIEAGKLTMALEPVPLENAVSAAVHLVQPLAVERNVAVRIVTPNCEQVSVMADPQRFVQVLVNLLTNAVKYNRPNGRIEIRCSDTGAGSCRIEVEDTGRGINDENLHRLFKPFERGTNEAEAGTGLGLALSRRLMELMEGRLELVSTSDAGTTFAIEVLAADSSTSDQSQAVPTRRAIPFDDLDGLRIVYIEDNLSNLQLMERLFENAPGIQLVTAMRASSGLEAVGNNLPDLVLLDLHLPDRPGIDVLRDLRANPATAGIPIVVVSADATEHQINRLLKAGAKSYLTKPIDLRALYAELKDVIKDSPRP